MSSSPNDVADDWHVRYCALHASYKAVKAKNREQTRRARQLMVAVKAKLDEKEEEVIKLRNLHNNDLTSICQHLLTLQSSLSREKSKLEAIIVDKEQQIQRQKLEIERLSKSLEPDSNPASVTLDRHRPGAARLHGSFRQYRTQKKQQTTIKIVNQEDNTSLATSSLSSEESSTSPNATPKKAHPMPKKALRLTLSTGAEMNQGVNQNNNSLSYPKKGILKTCSSYGSLDSASTTSILANLQKLIVNHQGEILLKNDGSTPDTSNYVKKLSVSSEERSDSGRESDEMSSPQSVQRRTKANSGHESSENSSFDGSYYNNSLNRSIQQMSIKQKPKPPPRASTTRLTSVKKEVIPEVTNKSSSEVNTDSKTIVNIVKKRVKFELSDETSSMEKKAIMLLEESIKNYKPIKEDVEMTTRFGLEEDRGFKKTTSYYEPYI